MKNTSLFIYTFLLFFIISISTNLIKPENGYETIPLISSNIPSGVSLRKYANVKQSVEKKYTLSRNRGCYQQESLLGRAENHYVQSRNKYYRLNNKTNNGRSGTIFGVDDFLYTLRNSSVTSAGVFDGDILIRTLWSNEKKSAGTYDLSTVWDGKDDNGNYAADKNYTIKVVSNNVTYDWLQPVGNTSDSATGSSVHHAMQQITNMVQVDNAMYYATGYNEVGQVHSKFAIGTPNRVTTTLRDAGQVIRFLATDGKIVYSAGQSNGSTTFITGLVPNPANKDALATFSAGRPHGMQYGNPNTYSAFDITGNSDYITGLAVQQAGNYLFASHKTLNQIRVFNKISGVLLQTITDITAPRELAISGSTLWVISGTNTVAKYTINSNGTLSKAGLMLSGIIDPLSVAVSPDDSKVAVADRGNYHQVKFFSTSTGALISTLGRTETYTNPTVYNDKFYFNNTRIFREDDYGTTHAFVNFQSDGSIWIGDYGNMRCQHFRADGTYIDNIQYMGYSYSCQADINNPTRLFSDFLEFNLNYTTGVWKFVRNWSKNIVIPTSYDADRMRSVATLSNGRTYCLYNVSPGDPRELLELDPSTGLRHTKIYTDGVNCELQPDGSMWKMGDGSVGQSTVYQRKPLTGFNNNNPQWGSYITLETVKNVDMNDPITSGGYLRRQQQTSSGMIATFSSDNGKFTRGKGWHLGGFKNGQWLFKTSPSTRDDYIGDFPIDGAYDIGNGVNVAGSFMQVVDRHIFWGYNGEFWKGSQTNKYNHYLDNGLMVGQFGTTAPEANLLGEAAPTIAGNANAGTYVKVGNDIHFFHCDESVHGAIHHWKISNLNSIQEQSFSFDKKGTPLLPSLPYIDLMAGLPVNGAITSGTGRWTYSPATYNQGAYNLWKAQAGLSTYKRNERSIRFTSYPNADGSTREGYCNLTVTKDVLNNYSTWQITGRLTYPEIAEPDENFIDIVDNLGKVIVRISRPETYPNASVKANNTTIISENINTVMKGLFMHAQDLSIQRSGNKLLVRYANFPEVSVAAFDPTANLSSPTKLRIHFYSVEKRGHQIDLANLRFYPAPTVVVDTGTGLTGQYFNNKTLSEPSMATRNDSTINFYWGSGSALPGQLNNDYFAVRWSGQIQAPVSGTYVFSTACDDGVRLWINGSLVIDNWIFHPTVDNSVPVSLTAGQKYDIKLEYYEGVGGASIRLMWAYSGQAQQIIPKQRLYPSLIKSSNGRMGNATEAEGVVKDSKSTDTSNDVKAYPVPAHDFLWIKYYAKETGDVSIQLVNVNAQSVLQSIQPVVEGENTIKVSIKELTHGIYLLNLTQGYRRVSQRVLLSD